VDQAGTNVTMMSAMIPLMLQPIKFVQAEVRSPGSAAMDHGHVAVIVNVCEMNTPAMGLTLALMIPAMTTQTLPVERFAPAAVK